MARNNDIDPKSIIAFTFLAVVAMAVAVGIVCAGLLALYFAKLREEKLLKETSDPLYPFWISAGMTATIVAGSIVGSLMPTDGQHNLAVQELYRIATNGAPLQKSWGGALRMEWGTHYFAPLLFRFAVPFWIELCAALYLTRWGVKKWSTVQTKDTLRRLRDQRTTHPLAKAVATGYMGASFFGGNLVFAHYKYANIGCDPAGPICKFARSTEWLLPAFIVAKIATAIDAWLILPNTIIMSFGNQFKLTELYPGLLAGFFVYRWVSAGGSLQQLRPPKLRPVSFAAPAVSVSLPTVPRWFAETIALTVASACAGALSFWVVVRLMDN